MLEVNAVTCGYGGIVAVRGASLAVQQGAIVTLIGSNGAGKSTLLNTISGFVRPREGSIHFRGGEIGRLAPHRIARMGVVQVPEGRQVLGPLSVLENLRLGSLAASGRVEGGGDELQRVYDLFPILAQRTTQQASSLSGGEQQMLAIGRALMGRPELLLLDEPSLGLAPKVTDVVFDALIRLNRQGLTILLVEQNARRALEVAQVAYVIERGSIARSGPARELMNDPDIASHYLGRGAVRLPT